MPTESGTTSLGVKCGDTQLAVYYVPRRGYYATQQMCPHRRAFVLDHGIIGDSPNGDLYVSCPLHKRNFTLTEGVCLNDPEYQILTFDAREAPDSPGDIQVLLPPEEELDAVLGTERWLVRQAQSEALGLNAATQIDIVGPSSTNAGQSCAGGGCGSNGLEW